jgi:3-oxoacyl-[acyl-carrier protein] reductase
MQERVALVTGASGGLGAAIASRLAAQGTFVLLHYRADSGKGAAVEDQIRVAGGRSATVAGDIRTRAGIEAFLSEIDKALSANGLEKLDILIDNAGVGGFATVEETSETMFDDVCSTNLKGTFFLTQGVLKRMRDGGRIVVISSGASKRSSGPMAAYAMTKAALNTFVIYLAQELGSRQITCNALGVGPVETAASATFFGDESRRRDILSHTALHRLATPDDIAKAVALFASAESGWITGQYVEVSGGYRL